VRYEVTHNTSYEYDHEVSLAYHLMRLKPREEPRQRCLEHELRIEPLPALTGQRTDYFGNTAGFCTIEGPHKTLAVTARSLVEVWPAALPDLALTPAWESVRELCRGDRLTAAAEAEEFAFPSPLVPRSAAFAGYAATSFLPGRPLLQAVLDLTGRIHREFSFDPKATTVATPLEQVFKERRGVCQDFAHFQMACLRSLGLPVRYVSGYLETLPPPGRARLVGADASHAWLACYCPGHGWVDVDPTNNLLPSARHVTVAWGRDFNDVSPIRGVLTGGGAHSPKVSVDVRPVG